jgi:hypothetical protein
MGTVIENLTEIPVEGLVVVPGLVTGGLGVVTDVVCLGVAVETGVDGGLAVETGVDGGLAVETGMEDVETAQTHEPAVFFTYPGLHSYGHEFVSPPSPVHWLLGGGSPFVIGNADDSIRMHAMISVTLIYAFA